VALLGANGAGKSTTLKAISDCSTEDGEVTRGEIIFDGERINGQSTPTQIVRPASFRSWRPPQSSRHDVAGKPAARRLTRSDNEIGAGIEYGLRLFPAPEGANRPRGYLSGGEQQMLADSAGPDGAPKMILMDEPSMDCRRCWSRSVRDHRKINRDLGVTILLV